MEAVGLAVDVPVGILYYMSILRTGSRQGRADGRPTEKGLSEGRTPSSSTSGRLGFPLVAAQGSAVTRIGAGRLPPQALVI
ncbi:MAG: hypothetical protein V2B18_03315 [Pseudomonadota bacterium]